MEDSTRPVAEWISEFSRRLTRHRLNQDLTQAQLAREAGISLRTVARIEAGDAVQLESFLRAIVALGLGGRLASWIPEVPQSPIQQLERGGEGRQRASRRSEGQQAEDWSWEDDS